MGLKDDFVKEMVAEKITRKVRKLDWTLVTTWCILYLDIDRADEKLKAYGSDPGCF